MERALPDANGMGGYQVSIPDDPRIRDAENNGMPESDVVICPCCLEECNTIYYTKRGREAVGCENCIDWDASWAWADGYCKDGSW